jgi:hypothetical protein
MWTLPQQRAQKFRGVSTGLFSTKSENWRWRCFSPGCNPYTCFYMERILTVRQTTSCCTFAEKVWRVLVMCYDIQYISLNPHLSSPAWEYLLLSDCTIRCFKHTSVRLIAVRISVLIFRRCSERISIAKTTHELHICKLRIIKSRHFCCCFCRCTC